MICSKCGVEALLISGDQLYKNRPDLAHLEALQCPRCHDRVSINREGKPSGTLADADTRKARMWAHKVFDELWQGGYMKRKGAYLWLAIELDLPYGVEAHIGNADLAMCSKIIELAEKQLQEFQDARYSKHKD